MNAELAVSDLERALLDRAKRLAEEYLDKAHDSRERIIQEENERLRLREEREMLAAEAEGERVYRRSVQANELKLQAELDMLRWDLVVEIKQEVISRLTRIAEEDGERYEAILSDLLCEAAESIDADVLVVEMNKRDLQLFTDRWERLCSSLLPGRELRLATTPARAIGGVLVRSEDNRVMVDNTFEGRMERMEESLNQAIIERLFAQAAGMGNLWHG